MDTTALRRGIAQAVFAHGHDETAERATMASLGLEHPDRQAYVPSAWWVLRWLLPRSDARPSDVFVEFGCGKGRVLLDAARRYRFRRVIGVELSDELAAVARELVERDRMRGRLRSKVEINVMDATAFKIPDDMTFAYFFNPFNGAVFQRVLDHIVESLDRAPRNIRVIYVTPVEHVAVMATGRFRVLRSVRTTRLVGQVQATIYDAA